MLNKEEIQYLLDHLPILHDLTFDLQNYVFQNLRKVNYPKNTNLYSGEHQCLGLVLVKQGTLRASLLSEDGKEVTLFRLHEDELCLLSASCIINSINFDIVIESSIDSIVYVLPIKMVEYLKQNVPSFNNYIQSTLLERFSETMWTIEQILFKKLDVRVATYLLDEANRLQTNTLSTSQEEIAKNIASAREAVSRILSRFVQEEWIEVNRKEIIIKDKEQLRLLIL